MIFVSSLSFLILFIWVLFFLFLIYFINCTIAVEPLSPLYSPPPSTLFFSSILPHLPLFLSMSCTYKFFGFSISYTILNLPLSILDLQVVVLSPCTFPPFSSNPFPADNPPCDLHIYDSVPVLVVCLVFGFFFLDSGVDSCELLLIVLIFFFLSKSL